MTTEAPPENWVEEVVALDGLDLIVHRPSDATAEELIDMQAYDRGDEPQPYWCELWPSGIALARVLRGRTLGGMKVLELGCGLGLPSVVAALGGASVLATDFSQDALEATRRTARLNHAEVELLHVDWRSPQNVLERGPFDLVIAADVLYEAPHVDALFDLITDLKAPVVLTDPGRQNATAFVDLMTETFGCESFRDPQYSAVRVYSWLPR